MTGEPITRAWPDPDAGPLTDDELTRLYATGADPTLRVNFVTSVDGAVDIGGYSAGLSSGPDKRVFGVLRMLCDALVVGAGTLRHEGYRALRLDARRRAWRREHGRAEYPTLVVVSAGLELDPDQAAFADAPVRPLVLTPATAPAQRRARLAPVADVLTVGDDRVDPTTMLGVLRGRGLAQLLCEGGPQLFGALSRADAVDELCLTVSPVLAGPGAGRITSGAGGTAQPLTLRHILTAQGALLLRYTRP
ncbi:MAG TPA: pyrimidine reductase family protein [Catenuloplanes sp.]|jgi:riboflavin biosynthesis pyrimidine reductase